MVSALPSILFHILPINHLLPFFFITMAGERNSLHPSLSVTNIKNHIPIQLELESGLYSTWSQLFQTHYKAYRVLDHIISNMAASDSSSTPVPDKTSGNMWTLTS